VIRYGDAVQLRIDGDNYDPLQFEVIWPPPNPVSIEEVEEAKKTFLTRPKNPALAVTHGDTRILQPKHLDMNPECRRLALVSYGSIANSL
jgi:hypothetical protein